LALDGNTYPRAFTVDQFNFLWQAYQGDIVTAQQQLG
jgi:hypothetical protein